MLACASNAAAQGVLVIEASQQDHAVADKLQELVSEPLERRGADSVAGLDLSYGLGCSTGARLELVLDSAHYAVRLVRCRDFSVLTRTIDPQAARDTPYLGAFVAAELLALDSELGSTVVESRAPPPPTAAAVPGTGEAPKHQPTAAPSSIAQLRLRLGADWMFYGEPFAGGFRPNLGLGVAIDTGWSSFALLVEVHMAAFATAEVAVETTGQPIELTRHDAQLRLGGLYGLGPVSLFGFLFARGSLSEAERGAFSSSEVRWGVGAGAGAELPLVPWLLVYTNLIADLAITGGDYKLDGLSFATDPRGLLSWSAGLVLRGWL
ncbi:MAG TPA: hypothetical protein VJV78_38640 [Polyangiales bacterium]|nr:hypothetical protein [Polyangiales bacterium]